VKITKTQLKQIIKEEISKVLSENNIPTVIQNKIKTAFEGSKISYQKLDAYDIAGFLDDYVNDLLGGKDIFNEIAEQLESDINAEKPDDEIADNVYVLIMQHLIVVKASDELDGGRALMPSELAGEIAEKLKLNSQEVEKFLNSNRVLKMLSDNNIGLDDMYQFVKTKPRKGPYQHTPSALDLTDYSGIEDPTATDLREVIKEELKKALAEASTITDPSGEHARTYRSSEDEQKRYLRKAKQDAAALKRLKDTDPEEYKKLIAKKQQDRKSFRARSASNKDEADIKTFMSIIQDLMRKGVSLEAAAESVRSNNPAAVDAAFAKLKKKPE
jgi:hypothetical protein